jgi:hypothetical protein
MFGTTRSFSTQETRTVSKLATIAIAAITYFAVIIVILHFLRPDLNPISRTTSEYAVGSYGFLMTSAFFSMSLASWALIIGIYQGTSGRARSQIGLALLGIWAVGVLIAMVFPIDPEGAPQTLAGTIHAINGPLIFLSLTVSVILISQRFKLDEKWRAFHRLALILALVMLGEFISVPVAMATGSGLGGLAQRIFLTTFVTWFVLTAARLRSIAIESN